MYSHDFPINHIKPACSSSLFVCLPEVNGQNNIARWHPHVEPKKTQWKQMISATSYNSRIRNIQKPLQCGAPKIAKLVQITPINMVYGTQITIVNGVYKPTYNWGAHIVRATISSDSWLMLLKSHPLRWKSSRSGRRGWNHEFLAEATVGFKKCWLHLV